jgi:hypothetical protein
MPKVDTGDLVCLYRRRKKGLGIVVERIDDILEIIKLEDPIIEVMRKAKSLSYFDRVKYIERITKNSADPGMTSVFFAFNAQTWCKKPKYKFARVKWFKLPSAYESAQLSEDDNWCPEDWLKKIYSGQETRRHPMTTETKVK